MPSPRWLFTSELAAELRMTPRGVRALASTGKLPGAIKVGADWRFNAAAIDRWLGRETPAPLTLSARIGLVERPQSAPLTEEEKRYFGIDGASGGRTHGRRQAADAGTKGKARLAG